jgi:tetratricopeptide (TPR) repeat protein
MTSEYYSSFDSTLPFGLRTNEMVQRQRTDPGGSRGGIRIASGEPDATVIRVKGDSQKLSVNDIVVDAIDSRHVVDEIRDSSPVDDRQKDGLESLIDLTKTTKDHINLPRSSWFDVFDWHSVGESTVNQQAKTMVITDEVVNEQVNEIIVTNMNNEENDDLQPKLISDELMSKSDMRSLSTMQPYHEDYADNSIVTADELPRMHFTNVPSENERRLGASENKAATQTTKKAEDLSLCALVMDETILETEPTTTPKEDEANTDDIDNNNSICMCFPGTGDMQPEDHNNNEKVQSNNDFLSAIFACIDPSPKNVKEDGDMLLDEIEKSLTSGMDKENGEENDKLIDEMAKEIDAVEENPQSGSPGKPIVATPKRSVMNSLTPEASNMILNQETEDKSVDDPLFNRDLESLPSVKEEVEDSVGPIKAQDLGTNPNTNSAALVERNAMELKMPANTRDEESLISSGTGFGSKQTIDPSFDARRSLLIKELRAAIATFGRYDVRCANISAALGDLMDEAKDYDHAVKLHKDAGTIYSCKLGDDHETTLRAKMRLGTVLENSGRIEEAITNYYQVTVMQRALHGDKDPTVAEGLVNMAHALRKKGDYQAAIKELKRALKIFRETLGDAHEKVASTVDEIASLYVTIGDFNKSAAILEEVVKLKAATMGLKSKSVASTLGNLATAYECSEKFDEAMKALKKSYKIYTETGGYSSEDATSTLNRMAQLYEAMKDPNRAAVAYLGVLRGRKIQRGADHLSVGETYFRLGHSLRETKQYDKALKCLKEALPIFVGQGVEMNDVKMVAEIMHEMAMINEDRGHYQDASRIFKQELSVLRKIGQPEYPFAARTLKHLGITEYKLNNYSRSLKYLVEALTIYQKHNEKGLECADVLVHTGLVFYKVENKDRALDALKEAVHIYTGQKLKDDNALFNEATKYINLMEKGLQ